MRIPIRIILFSLLWTLGLTQKAQAVGPVGNDLSLPSLVYPVPNQSWYVCPLGAFTSITVNAHNPAARLIYVRVKNVSTGEEFGSFDNSADAIVLANETEATSDITATLRIGYPKIENGTTFIFTIILADEQKNILSEAKYEVTGYQPFTLRPAIRLPEEGATVLALKPSIVVQAYPVANCDQAAISYEIDTYPADWKGEDYVNTVQMDTVWQVPVLLKPARTYEIRVQYLFRSGIQSPTTLQTFTTPVSNGEAISSVSPNPFESVIYVSLKPSYKNAQIMLINQDGKVLIRKESRGGHTLRIDTEHLPPTLYLVEIRDQTGMKEQFKVIKR